MTPVLRKQNTICRPVNVSGFGYWSSLGVNVEFRPAPANHGIVFIRRDIPSQTRIPAAIGFRADAPRRTSLFANGSSVDMVEHIMAALYGLQIDNCEIWVDRAEMPGCDGSSIAFVEAIQEAGIECQDETRPRLVIEQNIRVGDEDCWIQAEPNPEGTFQIHFALDYPNHPVIGKQDVTLDVTPESFCSDLASARTFILKHEADYLHRQGLGRRATYRDLIVFDENGPVDNSLRFENECARHKALDVVGDFALAPFDIVGKFTANRSGHKLNAEMVKQMLLSGSIVRSEDVHGIRKSA